MRIESILLWVMFFMSLVTVIQRKPFHAVLMRMALSTVAVGVYAVYLAPDVAITEAMLGVLLMTFIYILILKIPGKVRVGYVPTRFLFEEYPSGFDGIQFEIVKEFAKEYGYKLEYEKFDSLEEIVDALDSGYIDLACGPITTLREETGLLETKLYEIGGRKLDFLSLQSELMKGSLVEGEASECETAWYTIGFSESHREFESFLKDLKLSGRLEKIKIKYVRL